MPIKALFILLSTLTLIFVNANSVFAQENRIGGMNLWDYCNQQNEGGSTLDASNTWRCESGTVIDLNAACVWQYNQPSVARQTTAGNPYSWACFSGNAPTIIPATPTTSQGQPNGQTIVLFDDTLATGWTDASYRSTNTIVTNPVANGTRAIAATIQQDGGFDIQSSGLQTTQDMVLHFSLRASQANQRYEVYADATYGQPLAQPVSLDSYGGQPVATAWRTYEIPLRDLNAANRAIRNIVIHEAASVNQPQLFIDQVELRTSVTTATATPTTTATITPTQAPNATATPTTLPTPTQTPGTNTIALFTDALANGWNDASYRATNTIVTTPVNSGTRAISTTLQADGGFDLQSVNGIQTTTNTSLRFSLRSTQANQRYEVYADTTYGQPLGAPVSLDAYGGQPVSTTWRTYTIPLNDLTASNRLVRNFVIHEAVGVNQPALFVDDVVLLAPTNTPVTVTPTQANAPTSTPTPTTAPNNLSVRRNIYSLSQADVQRLTNAFNTIRNNGRYQQFLDRHMQAMMTLTQPEDTSTLRNVGHRGPAFLPWHRALVWEFEQTLRTADPTITLPYWAFEQDSQTGQLPRVFSTAYFGGDGNRLQGDRVTDGPFVSWNIIRRIGRDPEGQTTLPTQADVNALMNYTTYDAPPYSETSNGFRNAIEGWIGPSGQWSMHNRMHGYVGGDMLPSDDMSRNVVNDPIFWVAHANLDRIWWQWQQTRGITNYQPTSNGPQGHNLNDVMQLLPERFTPAQTLDIRSMGYTYQ